MPELRDELPTGEHEIAVYQPVSKLALAALGLGIASPLAMLGPVLWIVPALAIAVALLAMLRISRAEGDLTGGSVALLGLILAVLFGVAAPTRALTRKHWLETRATLVAEQFIERLRQDKPYEAHQLMLEPAERKRPGADLPAVYAKDADLKERYERFLNRTLTKSLLGQGGAGRVELGNAVLAAYDAHSDYMSVPYRIVPETGTAAGGRLVVERTLIPTVAQEQWRVASIDDD